jgi:hypothetical protein
MRAWNGMNPGQVFVILPPCAACGQVIDPARRGVISFGKTMHEHHCMGCCLAWEQLLKFDEFARRLSLAEFRAWQTDRRRAAA